MFDNEVKAVAVAMSDVEFEGDVVDEVVVVAGGSAVGEVFGSVKVCWRESGFEADFEVSRVVVVGNDFSN